MAKAAILKFRFMSIPWSYCMYLQWIWYRGWK